MSAAEPTLLRRMLRSRWVRGSVVAVAVCVGAFEFNEWSWERKWQRYVEESRVRGVKLYIADFVPKEPIPDEENFAATPIWQEVFARGDGDGPIASKFGAIERPWPYSRTDGDKMRVRPARLDLAAWRGKMIGAKKLTAADATLSDGAAVLLGLEFLKPEFDEIRASVRRPKVRFPVKWEDGFAVRMPHYAAFRALSRMLQLSATAKLAEGNTAGAFDDWKTSWDLAGELANEPGLNASLVHVSVLHRAIETVQEGIEAHRWTAEQIEVIQNLLTPPNLIRRHVLALSSERALFNSGVEPYIEDSKGWDVLVGGPLNAKMRFVLDVRAHTRSWWRENQLWVNRRIDEDLTMWDADAEVMRPHPRQFDFAADSDFFKKFNLFIAWFTVPVYEHAGKKSLHLHATLRMAGLACALERFRIANSRYPERLDELVPQFIEKLPHDPCDGQPFRYRVTPDGYLLYSIGADFNDAGGKVDDARWPDSGPDWRWWSPEQ